MSQAAKSQKTPEFTANKRDLAKPENKDGTKKAKRLRKRTTISNDSLIDRLPKFSKSPP